MVLGATLRAQPFKSNPRGVREIEVGHRQRELGMTRPRRLKRLDGKSRMPGDRGNARGPGPLSGKGRGSCSQSLERPANMFGKQPWGRFEGALRRATSLGAGRSTCSAEDRRIGEHLKLRDEHNVAMPKQLRHLAPWSVRGIAYAMRV
jgi:hypothetical protein